MNRPPDRIGDAPAGVTRSASTWQQPLPEPLSEHRSALVAELAAAVLGLGAHRLRVAIDGPTAAGKTSLGHEVADAVSRHGRPVLRASLDDFKRPWNERHLYDRESGEGYYRNAFDYEAVRRLLLDPFAPGGSGLVALCSRDPLTQVDHSAELTTTSADAVLVVDGVFAFRPEINDCWDLRVWVEVDAETAVLRGSARDQDWAGERAEAVHRERYGGAEAVYLAEVRPRLLADVVVDNTELGRPVRLR